MAHARTIAFLLFGIVLSLQAQTGFVDLRSQPMGARVFIDDSLRGTTPLFLRLAVGVHTAAFLTPEGGTANLQFEVAENEVTRQEVMITQRPALSKASNNGAETGKITVITVPAGAEVTIDRNPTNAVSPVTIDGVPAGTHVVRASVFLEKLQDRFTIAETLQVHPGRSSLVQIDFEAGTNEGTIRVESNDPRLAITLRHIDSGKRYSLRQPGDARLVIGSYELEPGTDSLGLPGVDRDIRVSKDSLTIWYIPHYAELLPLKVLRDHPSYVNVETFLQRSMKTRPLSETRSDLYVTQNFSWWLGTGVALFLSAEILQSEENLQRSTAPGATSTSYRPTFNAMRGIGVGTLIAGALLTSKIDTVQVDLSFNQQANKKDEDFLRTRHADIEKTWQDQIDQQNLKIAAENRRRTAANLALPSPSLRIIPAELR